MKPVLVSYMNRIAIVCVVLLLGVGPSAFGKEVWTVSKLLNQIANHKGFIYNYTETKYMSFFQDPMQSKGILVFRNPDFLQKQVTHPSYDNFKIIGDKLIISRQDKPKREVLLSNYPELLALAESLRATLSGKQDTLKKYYSVKLRGSRSSWQLTLTPTDIDLVEIIEFVEIRGKNEFLQQVTIKEVGGDKSVLKLLVDIENQKQQKQQKPSRKKPVEGKKNHSALLNALQYGLVAHLPLALSR